MTHERLFLIFVVVLSARVSHSLHITRPLVAQAMSASTAGVADPNSALSKSKQRANYTPAIRPRSKTSQEREVKRTLALGADECWLTTSGARVKSTSRPTHTDFQCFVLKYNKKGKRSKGNPKYGPTHRTQVEAEDALFKFRCDIESAASRKLVDIELRKRLGTIADDATEQPSARTSRAARRSSDDAPSPPKRIKPTIPNAMSANPRYRLTDPMGDRNPNSPGIYNIFSQNRNAWASLRMNAAATTISQARRNQLNRRAVQRTVKLKADITLRSRVSSILKAKVASRNWRGLMVGGDDDEIVMGTSEYDRSKVITQAAHVMSACDAMNEAVSRGQPMTWRDACEVAADRNHNQYAGSTVTTWWRDLHSRRSENEDDGAEGGNANDLKDSLRFSISRQGKEKKSAPISIFSEEGSAVISPFHPHEGREDLRNEFISWARGDLEHLSIKSATNFINNTMLLNVPPAELDKLNVSYPVAPHVVSKWMKDIGFSYDACKKSYMVDTHNRPDVVEDRKRYVWEEMKTEVQESCWVQFTLDELKKVLKVKSDASMSQHCCFECKEEEDDENSDEDDIVCHCDWCKYCSKYSNPQEFQDEIGHQSSDGDGNNDDDGDGTNANDEATSPANSQSGEEDGDCSGEEGDESPAMKLLKTGHYYRNDEGKIMVELHVDCFPDHKSLMKYFRIAHSERYTDEVDLLGGFISVRRVDGPILIRFGQDETIKRAFQLNDCSWTIDGERPERKKGLGPGVMISAFVSREFGFGMPSSLLTSEVLAEVNRRREGTRYADEEAAKERGDKSPNKGKLKESPFVHLFRYGATGHGYWKYTDVAGQLEDCHDCLVALFPDRDDSTKCRYQVQFEFDSSSGHLAKLPDALCVSNMGCYFSDEKKSSVRNSIIKDESYFGDYEEGRLSAGLSVGSTHVASFEKKDDGSDPDPPVASRQKDPPLLDTPIPGQFENTRKAKTRDDLADEIIAANPRMRSQVDSCRTKTQLAAIALSVGIDTLHPLRPKIRFGYYLKQKGWAHYGWERGLWTKKMLEDKEVTLNGFRRSRTTGKKVKKSDPDYFAAKFDPNTSMSCLVSQLPDFKNEQTRLQHMALKLGCSVRYTPKAHPELAGRGIEYHWGYSKFYFQRINDTDPKKLDANVREAIRSEGTDAPLNLERARKFARKAREYKVLYARYHLDLMVMGKKDKSMDYSLIEAKMKDLSAHRSAIDTDFSFITNS